MTRVIAEKQWVHLWGSVETTSHVSKKLQQTGRKIIASAGLAEIHPELFSTSDLLGGAADDLGSRLLRASSKGEPLVEVRTMPIDDSPESLRKLFGVEERIILEVLWSRCKELPDTGDWVSRIESEAVALAQHEGSSHLESAWTHTVFSGYDPQRIAAGGQSNWTSFSIYEGVRVLEDYADYLLFSAEVDTVGAA